MMGARCQWWRTCHPPSKETTVLIGSGAHNAIYYDAHQFTVGYSYTCNPRYLLYRKHSAGVSALSAGEHRFSAPTPASTFRNSPCVSRHKFPSQPLSCPQTYLSLLLIILYYISTQGTDDRLYVRTIDGVPPAWEHDQSWLPPAQALLAHVTGVATKPMQIMIPLRVPDR